MRSKKILVLGMLNLLLFTGLGTSGCVKKQDNTISLPELSGDEVIVMEDDEMKEENVVQSNQSSSTEENWKFEVKAKGFTYDEENLTYELVWSDEFDYVGKPDPTKWGYDVGGSGWGNNELQYYTEGDNVTVDGEKLIIEARKEEKEGKDYTSTRLISKGKGDWLYGKIEVSAKMPAGVGTWPAIWMLSTDWEYGGWPDSGEIDIMEHVGYDMNRIHGTAHTKAYYHSIGTQKGSTTTIENVDTEFHLYAVEWLPDKIRFFVDGKEYYVFEPSTFLTEPTYKHWPFDKHFHMLINIAVGGNWGAAQGFDENIYPVTMEVDYVRVYQAKELEGITNNK